MNEDHDRGSNAPSSLESPHHVGPDGKVVYSPAQLDAIEHGKAHDARIASEVVPLEESPVPAFVSYVPPEPHVHEETPPPAPEETEVVAGEPALELKLTDAPESTDDAVLPNDE